MTTTSTAPTSTIARLSDFDGQLVTLKGWLYSKRSSGKLQFLQLRDGTGLVQVIVSRKDVDEASWTAGDQASQESSLVVSGLVNQDARAPHCGFEIHAKQVELVQQAALDYPITPKEHGTDFLMQHRHLWLRTPRQAAIMRIRHEVIAAAQEYLNGLDFFRVDSPIFTPNACEGTTNLFEVDYFEDKAYLSQSGQLYAEASAMALGKVYCFGPTFRAEKSKTRRHLTEFWMIEPEVAFQTFDENLELQEGFVSYIVQRVLERRRAELAILERDTSKLENVKPPFPRLAYDDAVDILKAEGHDFEWGGDFGSPDETLLASRFDRPVFVHRFPAKIKAFYMAPDPERPELALGADLLAPEGYGEIIGGGQRLADHDELLRRLNEHQLPLEQFQWYLDLRKFGSAPHGGFGMGIERCVAWICGVEHIREVIPFPRTIYRIYP